MRIAGISGSLRAASFNSALVREAGRRLPQGSVFECADLRLPLFDEDLEAQGMPESVAGLVALIASSDGVLISTPEYNKNISGVLKNALDWISRSKPQPLAHKPVAIMSAAAGRAGGERTQYSLRHCLTPFNPLIVQLPEVMVASPAQAFEDGQLSDERSGRALDRLLARFLELVTASKSMKENPG